MVTTKVTSISVERNKEGNLTDRVIIRLTDEIDVVAREVDEDGVITFIQGKSKTIKQNISVFFARIRQAVDEDFLAPFNFILDKATEGKINPTDALLSRVNAVSIALTNASVDIEATFGVVNVDGEEHTVCNYEYSNLKLSNNQRRAIAMRFAGEFGGITDVRQQLEYAKIIYGVE